MSRFGLEPPHSFNSRVVRDPVSIDLRLSFLFR